MKYEFWNGNWSFDNRLSASALKYCINFKKKSVKTTVSLLLDFHQCSEQLYSARSETWKLGDNTSKIAFASYHICFASLNSYWKEHENRHKNDFEKHFGFLKFEFWMVLDCCGQSYSFCLGNYRPQLQSPLASQYRVRPWPGFISDCPHGKVEKRRSNWNNILEGIKFPSTILRRHGVRVTS